MATKFSAEFIAKAEEFFLAGHNAATVHDLLEEEFEGEDIPATITLEKWSKKYGWAAKVKGQRRLEESAEYEANVDEVVGELKSGSVDDLIRENLAKMHVVVDTFLNNLFDPSKISHVVSANDLLHKLIPDCIKARIIEGKDTGGVGDNDDMKRELLEDLKTDVHVVNALHQEVRQYENKKREERDNKDYDPSNPEQVGDKQARKPSE